MTPDVGPSTARPARPQTIRIGDGTGHVHLVHEMAGFARNKDGDQTIKMECGAVVVYKRALWADDSGTECAKCWEPK